MYWYKYYIEVIILNSMWKILAAMGVGSALTMAYVMLNHECVHDMRESLENMTKKASKTIKNMTE